MTQLMRQLLKHLVIRLAGVAAEATVAQELQAGRDREVGVDIEESMHAGDVVRHVMAAPQTDPHVMNTVLVAIILLVAWICPTLKYTAPAKPHTLLLRCTLATN